MASKNESPCKTCTRVKNPAECGNKACNYWRAWFMHRWAEMRRHITEKPNITKQTMDALNKMGEAAHGGTSE